MKRTYVRPTMVGERFVANEYVAACGAGRTEYNFVCDAGAGTPGYVYQETNGELGLQKRGPKPDTQLTPWPSYYTSCNKTHKASAMDDFSKGYYVPIDGGDTKDVIIWRGEEGNNVHCTTNIKKETWEKTKS